MNIAICYKRNFSTSRNNSEILKNITNFEEKSYGISFNYENLYILIPYDNIISFALSEDDINDS